MRAHALAVFSVIVATKCSLQTGQDYWAGLAMNELDEALGVKWNMGTAKNVILFIGDGMDPNTVTATRLYKGKGESHRLAFEKFPHVGLLKTYSADKIVADSASAATALMCGVKANQQTVGVDDTVKHKDCESSLDAKARLQSLAALALAAGKSAGLVTTTRVTHATPSPLYAHSADRKWECEDNMPPEARNCKDIARQLIEDYPGKDLQVIMGGGRQMLVSNSTATKSDPLDTWSCNSKDGRNLLKTYEDIKKARGQKYAIVSNTKELLDIDLENTDYLLGVFANGHMEYEHARDKSPEGSPSISEMVETAIKVLSKNKNGFFLMVEGGNIDLAHHRGWARRALHEAAALERAVRLADTHTADPDTLLIVTSDHGHTLSINGYPSRGTSVTGIAQASEYDGLNYTTLSYSTGGPEAFQYYVSTEHNRTKVMRRDPSLDDTESFDYKQQAGITMWENAHGGGDVVIYAKGPQAHLFHNVHEQHYVYHAISYIAKMGRFVNYRLARSSEISEAANGSTCAIVTALLVVINFVLIL